MDSKKNIWYFHHYATPPTMSGLSRPSYLGSELNKKGHKVTVFAASYLHYSDENVINDKSLYKIDKTTDVDYIFINTPSSKKGYLARIINMYSFYRRLFKVTKKYVKETEKPDMIIASSPHPLTMIAGIKIAKKLKIPCSCEVRDFWPEVFFLGGVLKEKSILGKLLLWGEKRIYIKANTLIFLKEGDTDYIKEKKWDIDNGGKIDLKKCYYVNNGVDCKNFEHLKQNERIKDNDLEDDSFRIIYTGAIRPVNNIDNILDAAKLLKENKRIKFLIYGTGNEVDRLNKRIQDEEIENVKIKGYVKKKNVPYIISNASVNLLNYSSTKYNWNRGNSSNKLFEYMAAGKPIISTINMGYCPLKKYKCGITVRECTAKGLAEEVEEIYNFDDEKYNEMCINAKNASKDFDFSNLANRLEQIIQNTCNGVNKEIKQEKDKIIMGGNKSEN